MGYVSFFENFIQIVVLLFAWVVVLLAFFIWRSSSLSP
jgi:type IV secretion system protein TrbL